MSSFNGLLFMSFRQYTVIMGIATALCWTAWGFILATIDPFFATAASFAFFYVSFFLALLGTISLLVNIYYYFAAPNVPMYRLVQKSFRISFVIAVASILLLYLQAQNYLNLWIGGSLILVLVFGFIYSIVSKKKSSQFQSQFHNSSNS